MTHDANALVADLFRREWGHLVAALTRLLGPSHVALAEDVVHDALERAMESWSLAPPRDPKAWILQTARWRAIDHIRRARREQPRGDAIPEPSSEALESALAERENGASQLAMMFSICDERLNPETHVTLILRLLCGFSPSEIARAFLVETDTIDRRLHRGRARLRELGQLTNVLDPEVMRARQPSVMQALYLQFNEGFHGSDPDVPMHPAICTDAIHLATLLLESEATSHPEVHAIVALFCFHAARLPSRLDGDGVYVALGDQDRSRWDRLLIERGLTHLGASASGDELTRWHLEAGIAAEHALAPDLASTSWPRILALYDQLYALTNNPIVACNRALVVAEVHGLEEGRRALVAIEDHKLVSYHFYWSALGDLAERAGHATEAKAHYERAARLTRNEAERLAYQRKLQRLV
ncbi:MAG TPA: sigma-70 family RNA polymerase sigma factor [Kofleriaceae bacterium]